MPADAPIRPADCGWPAGTELAFAHWVDDPGQLGLPATCNLVSGERVIVLVSLRKISLQPMVGPAVQARGGCVRFPDGRLGVGAVPDDWQPPTP